MNNPTFREQYDKIVGAYMMDKLIAFDSCYCFVGNLLNNRAGWMRSSLLSGDNQKKRILLEECNGFYSLNEIWELENIFLKTNDFDDRVTDCKANREYEDRLYRAMERALLHLRRLHESKGEIIEDYEFTRRDLAVTEK